MDINTLVGLLLGTFFIILAILLDGWSIKPENLQLFVNIPSVLIVFGGTLATLFIRYTIKDTFGVFGIIKHTFFFSIPSAPEVINAAIDVMEGLLSMHEEGWLTADLKQAKATINGDTKKLNGINQLISLLTCRGVI